MHSGIQAVYFDAVGTLLYPDPPAPVVYARVGGRLGSRLTESAIAARFKSAWAREEAFDRVGGCRTSDERETRRWRSIVTSVLDDVSDAEACFQQLYRHFGRPEAWACNPQTTAVLECLARQGIRLGIASNYDHRLHEVVRGKPELGSVDRLVISSEVGWRKPTAEFFAAMVVAAGVPAAGMLYVGDDPANDYRGAEMAGLQPLLLDPEGRCAGTGQRRIAQLQELESWLAGPTS